MKAFRRFAKKPSVNDVLRSSENSSDWLNISESHDSSQSSSLPSSPLVNRKLSDPARKSAFIVPASLMFSTGAATPPVGLRKLKYSSSQWRRKHRNETATESTNQKSLLSEVSSSK